MARIIGLFTAFLIFVSTPSFADIFRPCDPRHAPDNLISKIQSTLKSEGFYKGRVDGIFGPLTGKSVAGYIGSKNLGTVSIWNAKFLENVLEPDEFEQFENSRCLK